MSAMEKILKIKVMVKKHTSQGTDKKQNNTKQQQQQHTQRRS